jgi:MinD-like ATPase involved in chromosome partitioning or flagellar assembly
VTPQQEPLRQPHPSPGAAADRSWSQAVLRDLVAARRDQEQDAGFARERAVAALPRTTPHRETVTSTAKGGRHRTSQPRGTVGRTRPEDTFDAATITGRLRHGEPLHRRALRWMRMLTAASRESVRLSELTTALHRPVTTGRRIAVTGARGGVGATTMSLLVGSLLAARRDDAVLALDADPHFGSLSWRAGLPSSEIRTDIAEQLRNERITDRQQLESLLPRTSLNLWVLGEPDLAEGSTATDVAVSGGPITVAHAVGRFFGVTVLDCGGDPVGWAAPNAALDAAHAAVLVADATVDGVRAMYLALEDCTQQPNGLLARSVIALVSRTPTAKGVDLKAAMRSLSAFGPRVVHVPYDRHLAVGVPIDLRRVSEPTLLAAMELAGVALELAVGQ